MNPHFESNKQLILAAAVDGGLVETLWSAGSTIAAIA